MLQTFEKMEIEFDKDGKPIMPTIFISPQDGQRLSAPTNEDLQALKQILERKKQEFDARQRHRKLS